MKKSEIISKIHSIFIIYFCFGWVIESQRPYLLLALPSIQYQFLINNNQCILTQLENKYDEEENKDKKGRKVINSYIGKKLEEFNIDISSQTRENIIHTFVYGCFLINYYLYI